MSAAEDQDIGPLIKEWLHLSPDDRFHHRTFQDAFLDKFDEPGTRTRDDSHTVGVVGDEAVEFFPGDGRLRGKDPDDAGFRHLGSGFDRRLHAHEGERIGVPEQFDRVDRRRVTSHHDHPRTGLDEVVGDAKDAGPDFVGRLVSIGTPSIVRHVVNGVAGKRGKDFPENRESAHTGVEHSNLQRGLHSLRGDIHAEVVTGRCQLRLSDWERMNLRGIKAECVGDYPAKPAPRFSLRLI